MHAPSSSGGPHGLKTHATGGALRGTGFQPVQATPHRTCPCPDFFIRRREKKSRDRWNLFASRASETIGRIGFSPARPYTGGSNMVRARSPLAAFLATLLLTTLAPAREVAQPATPDKPVMPGGELQIMGPGGAVSGSCPLKHTDVVANVAGFVGRTKVRQSFHNPLPDKIEAIYVCPLPSDAAVDEMVMSVGDRRIVGQVKQRDEARQAYEAAKAAGQVASLLDQERPNVFTQSLANVEPGAQVVIEISYVETLKYEDGWYEFVFPMVVGPRYMPGTSAGKQGEGFAPDTTQVPDASKISPVPTPPGTRA